MKTQNFAKSIFLILLFFALITLVAILKILNAFFIPLTVSILLSFVFYPFCKKLHKLRIPWALCVIIVIVVALFALYFIGNLLANSLSTIVHTYPKYEERFTSIYQTFCRTFKIHYEEDSSLFVNLWNSIKVRSTLQNMAFTLSGSIVDFTKKFLVVGLLTIFLLLEINSMKDKITKAFPIREFGKKILNIAENTISDVTHYISIKFIISLLTGILVFAITFFAKMDFPVLWGFLSFVLNFIPSFGSIISCALTTLFALLQFYPEWGLVLFIGIATVSINMILGNIIEPRWEGSDLGISPFIILVSLSFWGWMWGFLGMILAVPLMVIIKIVCENIELLQPFAVIIGTNKSHRRKKKEED
ncbi:MAG TPA: AI-2E family transporter [Treponema sp.]|nr:AI-2E family transporter [Treponema sp.]HBB12959.1 AI-2E family transporter [Treponema sp.]